MSDEVLKRQLEWLQRNRTRRERTTPVGSAVSEFVDRLWTHDIGPAEAAAEALADLTDEEFQDNCRVVSLDGGVMTIQVVEPSMVAVMRMKWAARLKRELPPKLSRGISQVRFGAGDAGIRIGNATD